MSSSEAYNKTFIKTLKKEKCRYQINKNQLLKEIERNRNSTFGNTQIMLPLLDLKKKVFIEMFREQISSKLCSM